MLHRFPIFRLDMVLIRLSSIGGGVLLSVEEERCEVGDLLEACTFRLEPWIVDVLLVPELLKERGKGERRVGGDWRGPRGDDLGLRAPNRGRR